MADKKPDPVECSICGEMIEPFWDGEEGMWRRPTISIVSPETMKEIGGPFHAKCMDHAKLYKRIQALENKVAALHPNDVDARWLNNEK